jgi:hypothetical protein
MLEILFASERNRQDLFILQSICFGLFHTLVCSGKWSNIFSFKIGAIVVKSKSLPILTFCFLDYTRDLGIVRKCYCDFFVMHGAGLKQVERLLFISIGYRYLRACR